MSQAQEKQSQERKPGKHGKREEELRVGNLNSVDTVPSEMTLRLKKAVKYYGTSQKLVLDGVSLEQVGKSIVEPVNAESTVKDVFVTLPSNSLKALAWARKEI